MSWYSRQPIKGVLPGGSVAIASFIDRDGAGGGADTGIDGAGVGRRGVDMR